MIVIHALLHELRDDTTFSDACVAHHDKLKQIIELGHY